MQNIVFSTNNDLDIPVLDPAMQATALSQPFRIWNYRHDPKRRSNNGGTYGFYTVDKEFQTLPDNPTKLINSRCSTIIELNFSTHESMPMYEAIPLIARKRAFSVLCQQHHIRVFVDLNVVPQFRGLNVEGVPKGKWFAYATRGKTARLEELDEEYDFACTHAETQRILFVVYGGGRKVQDWCHRAAVTTPAQILWLPEMMDRGQLKKVTHTIDIGARTIQYSAWVRKDDDE